MLKINDLVIVISNMCYFETVRNESIKDSEVWVVYGYSPAGVVKLVEGSKEDCEYIERMIIESSQYGCQIAYKKESTND